MKGVENTPDTASHTFEDEPFRISLNKMQKVIISPSDGSHDSLRVPKGKLAVTKQPTITSEDIREDVEFASSPKYSMRRDCIVSPRGSQPSVSFRQNSEKAKKKKSLRKIKS